MIFLLYLRQYVLKRIIVLKCIILQISLVLQIKLSNFDELKEYEIYGLCFLDRYVFSVFLIIKKICIKNQIKHISDSLKNT